MYKTLLFLILISQQIAFGQTILSGTILQGETSDPVAYVNVGVIGGNRGTVSDMNGKFSLALREEDASKKLRLSLFGFENLELTVDQLKKQLEESNGIVRMSERVFDHKEVEVRAPKLKEKILGRRVKSAAISVAFSSDQYGTELGNYVRVRRKSYVDSFNFYLLQTGYDSLAFRMNIYKCDENKIAIDSLLLNSFVFGIKGDQKGEISIDLKDEHIILHDDITLAIETIGAWPTAGVENSKVFFGAEFGGNAAARYTSQSDWENIPLAAPGLYLSVQQVQGKEGKR